MSKHSEICSIAVSRLPTRVYPIYSFDSSESVANLRRIPLAYWGKVCYTECKEAYKSVAHTMRGDFFAF